MTTLEAWKRRVSYLCSTAAPLLSQIQTMNRLASATYRDVHVNRYFQNRVVLIGDAAHCMSPQLGQGASMALLDAYGLAKILAATTDLAIALPAFDRLRRSHVMTYQRLSRVVTPIFQSSNPALIALRDRAFYPLSRVPLFKRSILKTLSGQQKGFFGRMCQPNVHDRTN